MTRADAARSARVKMARMLLDIIRVQYASTGCAQDIAHGGEPHF
jgi:hypothetical protein